MKRPVLALALLACLLAVPHPASGRSDPSADEERDRAEMDAGPSGREEAITVKVPLLSPAFAGFPVAEVNGEPITLRDFNQILAEFHRKQSGAGQPVRIDFGKILGRVIDARLVVQEAETIGLDELPEVANQIAVYSKTARRQLLLTDRLRTTAVSASPEDVERIFRDKVKEYKVRSVLFRSEEDAKRMEEEVRGGADFAAAAERRIAEGTAQGTGEPDVLSPAAGKVHLSILGAAAGMRAGAVSPVVRVKDGFVLFRLEEILYPENPKEREQAEKEALSQARVAALEEYTNALIRKYAKPDRKVIGGVDFEAKKTGFDKLVKDKRIAVRIQGEKPVTVGEWARALQAKFYHGVTTEGEKGRLNRRGLEVLDDLVQKRVLEKEALKRGIDKTDEYRSMVSEHRHSLLFGAFMEKVVIPDVKVTPEEVKARYEEHADEYTHPEMVRIFGMAFVRAADAQEVVGKVQKGSDIRWMKRNADGQVAGGAPGLLDFRGDMVVSSELPAGARKAVTGAKPGDLRIWESPEGHVYVLEVQEVIPARKRPLEEVQEIIASTLFNAGVDKKVGEWFERLRKAGDVKVYVVGAEAE